MTNRAFAWGVVVALVIGGLFAYGRWFATPGGTSPGVMRQEADDRADDLESRADDLQRELSECRSTVSRLRSEVDDLERKVRSCDDDCDD